MILPPEWAPQRAVLFTFPHRGGDWGPLLNAASHAMIAAANAVNAVTPTLLLVSDRHHFERFAGEYDGRYIELPTNDCWIRDYGPLTVKTPHGLRQLDFTFNGWGGKFPADLDDGVPKLLHQTLFTDLYHAPVPLELEGGSIEVNGRGALLTTTTCLLNPNRNGGNTSKVIMEDALRKYFGVNTILWLTEGHLIGDDTDAHVDTLARFLDDDTIAYVSCDDPTDPHYTPLKRMERELAGFTRQDGSTYELLPLPWCPAVYGAGDGHRLPATYANFLISNGHLFLPAYFGGTGSDGVAAARLRAWGRYTVVPVNCRPFIEQHGSLHCLTMQIPR